MLALCSALESCLRRVKDLKKSASLETKHAYIAYIGYILYIFYTYSICYAENCVVDRDAAAAAGQPPGQPSHPAARARGPFVPDPVFVPELRFQICFSRASLVLQLWFWEVGLKRLVCNVGL